MSERAYEPVPLTPEQDRRLTHLLCRALDRAPLSADERTELLRLLQQDGEYMRRDWIKAKT